ncbi:hypothetical protein DFH09DRAFT_899664 [Mycena vulgaris]|nr:hypothetical protein DFH09DRAFT_899664 [Mycena vulgaris]
MIKSAGTDILQRFVYWSIIVISVCSMVDVLALVYFAARTSFQYPGTVTDMPIRSSYIHLEDLYLKKHYQSSKIEPIINLPKVLQVVDSSQPNQVIPQWAETWATPHGIVPVNDRRFRITNTVSTVAQFRVLDFGMESCVITLTMPSRNSSQTIGQLENHLDVWRLKEDRKLDFNKLSWKSKPERSRLLGRFSITSGTTQQLVGFSCVSGTYLTIEIACTIPGPDCLFESVATQKDAVGQSLTLILSVDGD